MARSTIRIRKLAASSMIAISLAAAASAQAAGEAQEYEIEAQPLAEALADFSRQSNLMIVAPRALTDGRMAAAVDGAMTPNQALAQLLAGSGLAFDISDEGAISLRPVATEQSDAANEAVVEASLTSNHAVSVAAAAQAAPPMGPSSEAGEPGIVRGVVRAAGADAGLDGALIRIEETGQTTFTDNLGRFRFANVPAGRYTVTVSYLGFAEVSETLELEAGGDVSLPFQLASATDVIVVRGFRSARAEALNQERTAPNASTVVSSDLLGNFDGTTISEALRLAPGLAFQQDFNTGDGTNIIVRGLNPDFNTVTLNGVELPEGSGLGRSASLNNILADSVDSVTINKSLLPSQDSSGTGGLVEIETLSPLNRDDRFARFSVERRERDSGFVDDSLYSGVVSGRFGRDRNFGVGLSVQLRDRTTKNLTVSSPLRFGAYLPLDAEGGLTVSNLTQISPTDLFPFEATPGASSVYPGALNVGYLEAQIEDLSLGLNLAWDIAAHTSLSLDIQRFDNVRSTANANFDFTPLVVYSRRPVAALNGEERNALRVSSLAFVGPRYSIVDDQQSLTDVISFRGQTNFESLQFDYRVSYANGETETPLFRNFNSRFLTFGLGAGAFTDAAVDPTEGRVLSVFPELLPNNADIPLPLLSETGLALFSDPSSYRFVNGGQSRLTGGSERYSGGFSTTYEFQNGVLRSVQAGLDFEHSEFSNRLFSGSLSAPGATLADLGLPFDRPLFNEVGLNSGLFVPSISSVRGFYNNLDSLSAQGLVSFDEVLEANELLEGSSTSETEYAPYVQATFSISNFEVIGGVRLSSINIEATNQRAPTFVNALGERDFDFEIDNRELISESATQTELLPRVLVNYRPNENTVARASYFRTIARPSIGDLSRRTGVSLNLRPVGGPNGDLPTLFVARGNPDLDPTITDNFDFSVERYFSDVGVVKFGAFYKRLDNILERVSDLGSNALGDIELPDFTGANGFPSGFDLRAAADSGDLFVEVTQPINNAAASEIWGLEAVVERQLNFLPSVFDGLGVYANYTFTESSKDQPIDFVDPITRNSERVVIQGVRFNEQPRHSGTVGLTYSRNNFESNLLYSYQSRRQTEFLGNGLSQFEEEVDSLNLNANYSFSVWRGDFRVVFEAVDLLDDIEGASLTRSRGDGDTVPAYINGRSFLGGRELRLGLTATF